MLLGAAGISFCLWGLEARETKRQPSLPSNQNVHQVGPMETAVEFVVIPEPGSETGNRATLGEGASPGIGVERY